MKFSLALCIIVICLPQHVSCQNGRGDKEFRSLFKTLFENFEAEDMKEDTDTFFIDENSMKLDKKNNEMADKDPIRSYIENFFDHVGTEDMKITKDITEDASISLAGKDDHEEDKKEIEAILEEYYDKLGSEEMKTEKIKYFTDDPRMNVVGKSFSGGLEGVLKEEAEGDAHHYSITSYNIKQILVNGDSAIAMVVGKVFIDGGNKDFTTTYELKQLGEKGWKFNTVLVFVNMRLPEENSTV